MYRFARLGALAILALLTAAGCASRSANNPQAIGSAPSPVTTAEPPADQTQPPPPAGGNDNGANTNQSPPPASSWPSPEDCITYNPSNVTVQFASGTYTVSDGSKVVVRVHGQTGDNTGQKALALAQRYRSHCFIGRSNTRTEERGAYIFDYWRNASGQKPAIPGQKDDCSPYNRNNLTVEDMGDGNGWRVKDHDHVLHLFDNGNDARNGKLVLVKYSQICFIGDAQDDQDVVSYSL
jgi:hypothetical protein